MWEFKNILLNQTFLIKTWIFDKNFLEKKEERMQFLEEQEKKRIRDLLEKKEFEKRKQEEERKQNEKREAIFLTKNEKAIKTYITGKTIGVLWSNSYDWLNGSIILDKITFIIICKKNKNVTWNKPNFEIDLKTTDKEYLSWLDNCKEIPFENVGAIWQKDNGKTGYVNFGSFKYRFKIIENQNRADRKSPEYLINILIKSKL